MIVLPLFFPFFLLFSLNPKIQKKRSTRSESGSTLPAADLAEMITRMERQNKAMNVYIQDLAQRGVERAYNEVAILTVFFPFIFSLKDKGMKIIGM